ncbi:DUF6894 family protein [Methylobacterium soli]|uniref:DUF6894 domain-containing protein n=1 Tax=Methylobacterium soli TaxID=553447 RepID=A0A6L3SSA5_9HYPH|nr:hypothetical protein [Methylobacterium soli]KAB1070066.1 hypothetical protein F6X53_30525 [Methylobacterium soli]GJE43277.1 hypothetical protein AEGHOMDF_2456 [Methylobacterium soli]
MPKRYYFRVVCADEIIDDPCGAEAASIEEAEAEALAAFEEMRAEGNLPDDAGAWTLEIRSASGVLLRAICFR